MNAETRQRIRNLEASLVISRNALMVQRSLNRHLLRKLNLINAMIQRTIDHPYGQSLMKPTRGVKNGRVC